MKKLLTIITLLMMGLSFQSFSQNCDPFVYGGYPDYSDGMTMSFVAIAPNFNAEFETYAWDFGDGTSSEEAFPTHTYTEPGNYTISVTTTYEGCVGTGFTEMEAIQGAIDSIGQEDCYAEINFEMTNPEDFYTYTFSAMSYSNTVFDSYAWDFGDGTTSDEANPTHTYSDEGEYTVSLTVVAGDCTSESFSFIFIFDYDYPDSNWYPSDCYVDAWGNYTNEPLTINFMYEGYGVEFDSYFWDFGDGTSSNEATPTHTYAEVGIYEASLTVTSGDCEFTAYSPVWVDDFTNPNDSVWVPTDCYAEIWAYQTNFEDSYDFSFEAATYSNVEYDSYAWDFGDGTTSDLSTPTHTYADEGEYFVTLTVTSEDCEYTTETIIVVINWDDIDSTWNPNGDCYASFCFTQDQDDLMTLDFTNYSFGENNSYSWDFGDGSTSIEQNPTHTYTEEGWHTVSLTTTSADCEDTFSMDVYLGEFTDYPDDCFAFFFPVVEDLNVYFINFSWTSDGDAEYLWDFGDGSTSTEEFPAYTYAEVGIYTVSLTLTSENCSSVFQVIVDLEDGSVQANASAGVVTETEEVIAASNVEALVYPNPVAENVNLQFEVNMTSDVIYTVRDITGKNISVETLRANKGSNIYNFNAASLITGVYFIDVRMNDKVFTTRFVKQ